MVLWLVSKQPGLQHVPNAYSKSIPYPPLTWKLNETTLFKTLGRETAFRQCFLRLHPWGSPTSVPSIASQVWATFTGYFSRQSLCFCHIQEGKNIRVCKYEHLSSNVQHPCEKVMHTCNPRVDVGGDRWILSSLATSTVEKQLSPGSVRTLPHGDKAEW